MMRSILILVAVVIVTGTAVATRKLEVGIPKGALPWDDVSSLLKAQYNEADSWTVARVEQPEEMQSSDAVSAVDKDDDSDLPKPTETVVLKNGHRISGIGYELKSLGQLKAKLPVLLFSGVSCKDCDASNKIFVAYAVNGAEKHEFRFPGKLSVSAESAEASYESRVFYGECLTGETGNSVVSLYHSGTQQGATIVRVKDDGMTELREIESANEDGMPRMESLAERVASKKCTEVQGEDRVLF
jgi:hypothetical protein